MNTSFSYLLIGLLGLVGLRWWNNRKAKSDKRQRRAAAMLRCLEKQLKNRRAK